MLCISPKAGFGAEPDCMEATRLVREGAALSDGSDEEREFYEKAISLCPKVAEAHHNLGVLFMQKGDLNTARSEIEKALALRNSVDFRLALAHVLLKSGNKEGAESEYRQVLEDAPENEKALQGLSVIHVERGEHQLARELLERAIEKNPLGEVSLFNRAALAERIETEAIAEKYYRELLRVNPGHKEGVLRLAVILRNANNLSETQQVLKRALEKRSEDVEMERLLASVSEEIGDFDAAEVSYRRILSINPLDEDVLVNLASLYLRKRQHQLALETLRKVITLNQDNARALSVQGIVFLQLGRYDEAKESFGLAIAKDPSQAVAHYNLGLIHRYRGETEAANLAIAKAKALDSSIVD
jgi:Flp pilus assembly protein TadD